MCQCVLDLVRTTEAKQNGGTEITDIKQSVPSLWHKNLQIVRKERIADRVCKLTREFESNIIYYDDTKIPIAKLYVRSLN